MTAKKRAPWAGTPAERVIEKSGCMCGVPDCCAKVLNDFARAERRRGFRAGLRKAAKECLLTAHALNGLTGREYEAQQANALGVSFVEWARLATKPKRKRS